MADLNSLVRHGDGEDSGRRMFAHVEALMPLLRSITGPGLRQTLGYIGDHVPLQLHEVASGTPVLDWEVPLEWTVRDAAIIAASGERVVDLARSNLHLVQYSRPLDATISRADLDGHLHSLPDQPDVIPYRTAYYADTWGFCLSHSQRLAMRDPEYRVLIDADLAPGSLSYGECLLPGDEAAEVLFSVHCCHPSLANDNLSSLAIAIELAQRLQRRRRRFAYRFLFAPGTIGAITWLHRNRDAAARIRHGLVLSCLGDPGPLTYKQSRRGTAGIDRYAAHVLRGRGWGDRVLPFIPYGYDERQYCSPGFDLPVGCLMRSPNGTFPEYHTSADNLALIRPEALADSLRAIEQIVELIEEDHVPIGTVLHGEPQLGRRGLYAPIGGTGGGDFDQLALLWVLNLADGRHSLLDMAERSGKPFPVVASAARALATAGLLRPTDAATPALQQAFAE